MLNGVVFDFNVTILFSILALTFASSLVLTLRVPLLSFVITLNVELSGYVIVPLLSLKTKLFSACLIITFSLPDTSK